jgi:hypothetical protein
LTSPRRAHFRISDRGIVGFKHSLHDLIGLYDFRLAVPGDQPLSSSARRPLPTITTHHSVFGMVRYSQGLVDGQLVCPDFSDHC